MVDLSGINSLLSNAGAQKPLTDDQVTALQKLNYLGTIPGLGQAMQQNPQVQATNSLMKSASSTDPVYSPVQGIARVLGGAIGGRINAANQAKWGGMENYINTQAQNAMQSQLASNPNFVGGQLQNPLANPNTTNFAAGQPVGSPGGIAGSLTGGATGTQSPALAPNPTPGPIGPDSSSLTPPAPRVLVPGASARADVIAGNANRLDAITQQSESANNPNAVSPAGARGLMQVMPSTGRDPGYGVRPSNGTPEDDARMGRDYRAAMQTKYGGDLAKMWGAYNAGPGKVDRLIRQFGNDWLSHAPPETQAYVAKNLAAAGQAGATGGTAGAPGSYGPPDLKPWLANAQTFQDPGLPQQQSMPDILNTMQQANIPLPDRVQSTRLAVANQLLNSPTMPKGSLMAYALQPYLQEGLTEDQASKTAQYQAQVAQNAATTASARNLYGQEANDLFASHIADHASAVQGNIAAQNAAAQAGYSASAASAAAQADFARVQATNATKLEQQRIRNQGYLLRAQNMPGKISDDYQSANQARDEVDEVQQLVRDNPKAFDISLAHLTPYQINQRLDAQGNYARARVEALQNKITHDLFGSRQTDSEMSRINNMALHILDDPGSLNSKLQAMRDGYTTRINAMEHQYPNSVNVQNQNAWNAAHPGNLPQAGGGGGGGGAVDTSNRLLGGT